jgi:GNAT superfamily N-acetyltransferase
VQVRSWQATYQELVPQDFLDQMDPAVRVEPWRRRVEGTDWSRAGVMVAADDQVHGFICFGPTRDEGAEPARVGEVAVIYLLPEVWGMGLGRRLMAVALDSLTAAGYAEAMLWVHRSNDRARRFYSAGGWTEDGGVQDDNSHGFLISEVRYRKALPATRELSDDAN